MERINTENGLFAAGNPQTGIPGTIVTSGWLNDIQEELAGVIEGAGLVLDGESQIQLYLAIKEIIAVEFQGAVVVPTTPIVKGPKLIFVMDRLCHMTWVVTAFYTGYRSLQCGDWYIGSMSLNHRPQEIDGIGGIFDIAAYPSLWGWAQENNHVVDAAEWEPKWTHYALIGTTQFRVPDYRDNFPRVAGTDADTANLRLGGSWQIDQYRSHNHPGSQRGALNLSAVSSNYYSSSGATETGYAGGAETRPENTAVASVILV